MIVDNDAASRRKLNEAVRILGHQPESAVDGVAGLERLRAGDIDLLLLDLDMPLTDGFGVLGALNADNKLNAVPTIVISGVDEDKDITKAIQLGAIDFLPKNASPVLLGARVIANLELSRQRARETIILSQIEQLTKAAVALDSDDLNPMELEVKDIAMRPGPLRILSWVLLNKSTVIYNRRQAQAQQIRNLLGVLMLLVMGACFGLKPALAKLYLADIGNPLSVGFYTMGLSSVMILGYAVFKKVPWPQISLKTSIFCLVIAMFTLAPQVLLFWVAAEVPGIFMAIIISLESFMVFFVAAMVGLERINFRRLFGLLLGISGVVALLLPQLHASAGAVAIAWLVMAMCIPACFAAESILLALCKSFQLDLVSATVIIFFMSTLILLFAVLAFGSLAPLRLPPRGFEVSLVIFSLADTIATITFVKLIRLAGPVFTSQKAYTVAFGGVAWSVLLLHEALSGPTTFALMLIMGGLYFGARKPQELQLLQSAGGE